MLIWVGFGRQVVAFHLVHVSIALPDPEQYIIVPVHLEWDTIRDPDKARELVGVVLYKIPAFERKDVHLLLANLLILSVEIKVILILYEVVPSSEFYQTVAAVPVTDCFVFET